MNHVQPKDDALAGSSIHEQWVSTYRTAEAQKFYELAFDDIVTRLGAPPGSLVLDAGCGSCAKSVLLAARGLNVVAVDFSERALELGAATVRHCGLEDRVTLRREDLLHLSFPDAAFRFAVCWGVLMHVPALEQAVAELARVLAPGGLLTVSEGNMRSAQSFALRLAKRLAGRNRGLLRRTPVGLECIEEGDEGTLLTRQIDVPAFVALCARHRLRLRHRLAGQFTELYAVARSRRVQHLIHLANRFWFRRVGWARPAFGNILVFEKSR